MAVLIQTLRHGNWLTPERRRTYSLIVLALTVIVAVAWVAMADGLIDRSGNPIGTDFSNVYAAGSLVRDGDAAAAYDPATELAREQAIFGNDGFGYYGWHYPPFFLIVAAALATVPYAWALFIWMAATLPAYLLAIRAIVPARETVLIALAFPAVFVNLGHGQNGFLTAALLGAALLILDRRPFVAGLLIGLLAYKPQFGVLIPLVLAATGRWRAFASAAITVIALCALSTALFGMGVWQAFAASTKFTRLIVLEAGDTGWQKIQSIFSFVRMWGAPVELAYGVQLVFAVAVAASLVWLWRSRAAFDLKAAGLAAASLLATPYVLDYDLVAAAVAIAFLVRHGLAHGFRDWEVTVLAAAWLAPLVARSIMFWTGVPVGLIAVSAVYLIAVRRAAGDLAAASTEKRLAAAA